MIDIRAEFLSLERAAYGHCEEVVDREYNLVVKTYPIDNQACCHVQHSVILVWHCLIFTRSRLLATRLHKGSLFWLCLRRREGDIKIHLHLTIILRRGVAGISILKGGGCDNAQIFGGCR